MKILRPLSTALLGVLLLNPIASRADDIDLYSGLTGTANIPNIMVVVDNPSSQNNNVGPCKYWDNTIPSNGTQALGNDQCALANIVHNMSTRNGSALVNLGMTTMDGVILKLTPVDDNPYAGPSTVALGNTNYAVPAGSTNRQAIIIAVKALTQTTGKSGQGSELQETWAYYTGGNGGTTGVGMLSGLTYTGTNAITGCQKDYVIYLSNVKAGASHAQDNGELTQLTATVNNAVTAGTITAAQGTALLTAIPNNPEAGWGREWSRFMYNIDIAAAASGVQGIITYSVGTGDTAVPPAAITNDMEKYIQQVATYGAGKYFPAGTSYNALYDDILKILNEVQAVNSVFASSSLPVSVNAQGTYLNQIFMGMFRPDASGMPRWVGNLKQYEFGFVQGNLTLVDSLGAPAISGAGTGFISSNAVSFWTTKNTAVQPDSGGGFWRNNPQSLQSAGGAYDSPDGEMVEKGGAAQVARNNYLFENYAAAAGTSTNPRNMYTFCPSGSGCIASLTNSANAFATTNSGMTSTMFGVSNITVKSIERCVALTTNCTSVDGTTAVVTTNTNHGYATGDSVTVTGASPTDYDVTQNVTVLNVTQFKLTGLKDLPTPTTLGTYTVALHSASQQSVSTLTRSASATASGSFSVGCTPNLNCETATATFASAHGFTNGASVQILGATPVPDNAPYNGIKTIATSGPAATSFTYSIPVYPTTPAANTYKVVEHPFSGTITNLTKAGVVTTTDAPSFHVGEQVTVSGTTDTYFTGTTWTVTAVSATTVTINTSGNHTATSGTISPSTTAVTITGVSRAATTATATATATGLTAGLFANGDKVDITTTGAATNEGAYAVSNVTITCATSPANTVGGPCTGTTFTYPITVTPAISASGTMTAALSAGSVAIAAGKITRSGTTATVTGVTNAFTSGQSVDISTSGTVYTDESAYTGTWTITCPVSCSTAFTFGPVTLNPVTPATGIISCYSGTAPPDKNSLVNWVRGQDNLCDETSPDTGCPNQTAINIRPSLHGDVLHSRPSVINYGGSIGVLVFYGSNDGVFRAINGNQTNPAGSTLPIPGGELWSFIPTEFYSELTRLHDNSPVLKLSTTPSGITPTPRTKDYFVDGTSSVYQKINSAGTTDLAYLYLAMRRGGMFLYALDVTTPSAPSLLWKIRNSDADFTELGQTWSQPTVAFVKGYCGGTACSSTNLPTPVLIFGGGYDTAEDSEPPGTDTMGRGIFIVDAITGNLVWKATYGTTSACSGTAVKATCTVAGMNYSIPAEITLMDVKGNDGFIDRLYAVDTGGNIWRVDLEPTAGNTPDKWKVSHLAALGCHTGPCASGTPRKFLFPADVISTGAFTAVLIGSGDREHPLYSTSSSSAYSVVNRFYMVKDTNVGNTDGTDLNIIETGLEDITATSNPVTTLTYDGLLSGYYITLGTGEKVVNAPTTVAGYTYFGTNTSATPSSNSCTTNLGTAKGYQVSTLTGTTHYVIYDGGGLPPTAVAGSVIVNVGGVDTLVPFCIGCGGDPNCTGPDCKSASGGHKAVINVPTSRSRTYWYKEID